MTKSKFPINEQQFPIEGPKANVEDLYTDRETKEKAYKWVKQAGEALAQRFAPEALPPGEHFNDFLEDYDETCRAAGRLVVDAVIRFQTDTTNEGYTSDRQRSYDAYYDFNDKLEPFLNWWKSLPEATASEYLKDVANEDHVIFLERERLFAQYTLSVAQEIKMREKYTQVRSASYTDFSQMEGRLKFTRDIDGEETSVPRGRIVGMTRSTNAADRKEGYEVLLGAYASINERASGIYLGMVQSHIAEFIAERGYGSVLEMRALANETPVEAIASLYESVHDSLPVMRRFFALKAAVLRTDKLRRVDLFAPIGDSDRTYTYTEAASIVHEAFDEFDPRLAEYFEEMHRVQHIDVNPGPHSGYVPRTFWGINGMPPYSFMRFDGSLKSVRELAHESGHYAHYRSSGLNHSYLVYEPSYALGEAASLSAEHILLDKLLSDPGLDPQTRIYLLFNRISEVYSHMTRQVLSMQFEQRIFEAVQNGHVEGLDVAELYLQIQKEQLGDGVEVDDMFKYEWMTWPDFMKKPFNYYTYGMGYLVGLSLFDKCKSDPAFKRQYFEILQAGSSKPLEEILTSAGIDINDKSFWQNGLNSIKMWVDQLEGELKDLQ